MTHDCCAEARWTIDAICACTKCHPSGPVLVAHPSIEECLRSRQLYRDYGLEIYKKAERLAADLGRCRAAETARRRAKYDGHIGPGARDGDPITSHMGADDIKIRSGSHRARILIAYKDGRALTDDQAALDVAEMPENSCWWKRCSELRQGLYIEPTGKIAISLRSDSSRMTCVITERGLDALARIATAMPPL
jgi:hypothetical protein